MVANGAMGVTGSTMDALPCLNEMMMNKMQFGDLLGSMYVHVTEVVEVNVNMNMNMNVVGMRQQQIGQNAV